MGALKREGRRMCRGPRIPPAAEVGSQCVLECEIVLKRLERLGCSMGAVKFERRSMCRGPGIPQTVEIGSQ